MQREKGRLITARDVARRGGHSTVTKFLLALMERSIERGYFQTRWDGEHVGGAPAVAFVDFGRWLARCECGQHNYVDPHDAVMFCARCGNGNSGLARPVMFPANRAEIEKLLLVRPVIENPAAKNAVERALLAKPKIAVLTRNWFPGQTIADLFEINQTYGV